MEHSRDLIPHAVHLVLIVPGSSHDKTTAIDCVYSFQDWNQVGEGGFNNGVSVRGYESNHRGGGQNLSLKARLIKPDKLGKKMDSRSTQYHSPR